VRNLIVASAWLSPLVFLALLRTAPLTGLAIMAASHLLLVYATLRPNVQWLGPVITHFQTASKQVWLTIDDGPADDTPAVLEILARNGAKATFFVKGTLAASRPDLVRTIINAGHTVANHSHTHPSGTFWCLPRRAIAREIQSCNDTLRSIAGAAPRWFRAPVGMKNPGVHPELAKRGMRLIGWSARGFDGVMSNTSRVIDRIAKDATPGGILVVHQGLPQSPAVIDGLLATLKSRGYEFVVPDDEQLTARDVRSDRSVREG
jgi:peptidoglycan/xylan/chitin deacetylase (PgdA/CDA1 family)